MQRQGRPKGRSGQLAGRMQCTARGFGFFVPDDGSEDWYISQESMHGAMHGDRVLARRLGSRRGGIEGEVTAVETRAWTQIVGTVDGGCVVPDERRIPYVLVPVRGGRRVSDGDRVVARIEQYPDGRRPMLGRVTEVLGRRGEAGVDVLAVVRRFGIRDTFPKAVRDAAAALPQAVLPEALAGRLDLRGLCTVTIDGAHSKDFDDAVSLERLEGGQVRLGVHIADVCAYVRPGSAIDREARLRGTSVYFADRVIPMLPEELSNGICSLNEGEDRLTFSCLMDIDPSGRVTAYSLAESVIRSRHRLVYEDVTALIEGDPAQRERYADVAPMLLDLAALQKRLYARRHARGSIDFDIAESEIELDAEGRAVGLAPAVRGIANRVIEECMLLANETVAAHMRTRNLPCLYRVHEPPDPDRLRELNVFLQTLGYGIRMGDQVQPGSLQRVVKQAAG